MLPSKARVTFKGKGFVNSDGISSYANSVMQCLLLSPAVCQAMQQSTSTGIKDMCDAYTSTAECNLDCLQLQHIYIYIYIIYIYIIYIYIYIYNIYIYIYIYIYI